MTKQHKTTGEVYTPQDTVEFMLDKINYNSSKNILKKHIIDNSAGNGAFLCEIVKRYIKYSTNKNNLKKDLETYIHGIEINTNSYNQLINKLDDLVKSVGLDNVNWSILNTDALEVTEFNNKMDYVIGNPPYVRIHNLKSKNTIRNRLFTNNGMTDLYIAFYELSLNMLNENGLLLYLTPSSWWTSKTAKNMRNYISKNKLLKEIINYGHKQLFKGFTTYVQLALLTKSTNDFISYYDYSTNNCILVDELTYNDFIVNNDYFFDRKEILNNFKAIYTQTNKSNIKVKNGFATLSDKSFLVDESFKSNFTIDCIKSSTGKWYKIIFPYDMKGNLIKEDLLKKDNAYNKLKQDKNILANNPPWYAYGRTQAIKDVPKYKLSINNIIKDVDSIKLNKLTENTGVFGGLYIVDFNKNQIDYIENKIKSNDFINYIKVLKKYKSGGYYTFSSKDLEKFLNYER